jgi:hypothetical protein
MSFIRYQLNILLNQLCHGYVGLAGARVDSATPHTHALRFFQGQSDSVPTLNALKALVTAYDAEKAALGLKATVAAVSTNTPDEIFAKQSDYWTKRVSASPSIPPIPVGLGKQPRAFTILAPGALDTPH